MRERLPGAVQVPRLRIFAGSTPLSRLITGLFIGVVILSMLATMPIVFAQTPTRGTPTPKVSPVASQSSSSANTGSKGAQGKTLTPTALPPDIPADIANRPLLAQDISLQDLGISSYELTSPSGIAQFRFQIPDNWFSDGANKLKLAMEYSQTGDDVKTAQSVAPSIVDVFFDEKFAGSMRMTANSAGVQTLSVPLGAGILRDRTKQSHSIRIVLNATEYCRINIQTRLVIRSDQSSFHFEYRELPP